MHVDTGGPRHVEDLAEIERDALHHRARHMRDRVLGGQPDERCPRVRIVHRHALAAQVRQKQQSVGAGRHSGGEREERSQRRLARERRDGVCQPRHRPAA